MRRDPHHAAARVASGALLVDIRRAAQRSGEGEVTGYDPGVIMLCSDGCTSSPAADALRPSGCTAPRTSSAASSPDPPDRVR